MPSPGLSLVGFMDDQAQAIDHLRYYCVQTDNSDAALLAEWQDAKTKIGPAVAGAGHPDIRSLSAAELASLTVHPYLAGALANIPGSSFASVEIDPLLAYQFAIQLTRSGQHCGHLGANPSFAEIAAFCLPSSPPVHDVYQRIVQGQSAILKSRSLNLRMATQGIFTDANGPTAAGFLIQLALPLAHVVRLNGKCYLHNGFHRAYGLRKAGVSHIPCIFRDVPNSDDAGIKPPGTFALSLLESSNPPTLAHFTRGSARAVQLRAQSRILHVAWADYVVFDE